MKFASIISLFDNNGELSCVVGFLVSDEQTSYLAAVLKAHKLIYYEC